MNIEATADLIMSAGHSDAFDREACVKILRDNLSGAVDSRKRPPVINRESRAGINAVPSASAQPWIGGECAYCNEDNGNHRETCPVKAQPKPEPWPEIAREAATDISDWEAKTYGKPDYSHPSQAKEISHLTPIILAAIECSHAAQPQPSKASSLPQQLNLPCGCTIEQGDSMKSSVFWNEFNRVVQCHKCGQVYEPASPLGERSGDQPSPAAEREKLRQANESADGWRDQCSDLCEQLAAERQRREQVEQELWTMRAGDKVKDDQLLSALAAIEEHNDLIDKGHQSVTINVDLSALEKHDTELATEARQKGYEDGATDQYAACAEVRKPLVRCITGLSSWLRASLNCRQHLWEPDQRAAAQETIDDALSKAKP